MKESKYQQEKHHSAKHGVGVLFLKPRAMKKNTITTILLLSVILCFSQDKDRKTKFIIGSNITYNYEEFTFRKDFASQPNSLIYSGVIGLHLSNSFSTGISYEHNPNVMVEVGKYRLDAKSNSTKLFLRYQGEMNTNFYYFAEIYIGKTKYKNLDYFEGIKEWNTEINFGLMYYVIKHLSIEVNLLEATYYERSGEESGIKAENKEFLMIYDILRPNIGIRIYI